MLLDKIEQRLACPSKFYKEPSELLEETMLTDDQKIVALENWKSNIDHQRESSQEGMIGVSTGSISQINKALMKLKGS